jgi:hypothetical protein
MLNQFANHFQEWFAILRTNHLQQEPIVVAREAALADLAAKAARSAKSSGKRRRMS